MENICRRWLRHLESLWRQAHPRQTDTGPIGTFES